MTMMLPADTVRCLTGLGTQEPEAEPNPNLEPERG